MKISNINRAADILLESRIKLNRIENLPRNCTPVNKEEAYKIQNKLVNKYLLLDKKNKIIGKKVGCTNKAAQIQINVHEPFYGNLFSTYSSESNCIIQSKNFFGPFIEPEFSFKISKTLDISDAPYSINQIYNVIESVLPSIELVDSRFNDWKKVGIYNLIADNAVNAFWIYGKEINKINDINFSNHEVTLSINDKIIEKGNSSNVLDNPINSITWLVNTLAKQGRALTKNSYISTGTCTSAISIKKGDKICADFGTLGKVNFLFL